ncbi:hypothetical protein CTI12_AA337490 [Artemisia annua]|uniref:Uncharacterized protein n=1 Tax=Artemisia annua TaxID=35608 RepID=A0A2U1MVY3_ARTAN|nr:hypothetical protein CTI12_AA337490 [Artemisia annua]
MTSSPSSSSDPGASVDADKTILLQEGPETVKDFDKMDVQEIQDNIQSRRNKIFLHMK